MEHLLEKYLKLRALRAIWETSHEPLGEVDRDARLRYRASRTHLERHLAEFRGPVEVQQFQGGQSSNLPHLYATAKYVMRSKPGPPPSCCHRRMRSNASSM